MGLVLAGRVGRGGSWQGQVINPLVPDEGGTNTIMLCLDDVAADVVSMLWTLRMWPLELINWNTSNTQRIDLFYKVGDAA